MGWYIHEGPSTRKAAFLITEYDAKIIDYPISFDEIDKDKALVCVVKSGVLETVAYCFDAIEMKAFSLSSDPRKHTWLLIDKKKVEELTGYSRRINPFVNSKEAPPDVVPCSICGLDSPKEDATHLSLYVTGSEGIVVCLTCRIALTEHVRSMRTLAGLCRMDGYKACKEVHAKEIK